jgi:hypothetical protein
VTQPPRSVGVVAASLRHSARLLLGRPGATLALGAAIVLGLISVCFGVGVVLAPWLLCELLALQLGEALGEPTARSRSWASACVILLGAVLLTASVGWLTWLGLGEQSPPLAATAPAGLLPLLHPGGLLALASAVVSLVFVLPFLYSPLILIETRAGLAGAVLESARLVATGGLLRNFALSLAVNAVQAAPLLIAAFSAELLSDGDSGPLFVALSLPLLALSIPLGQGMLVSAYVRRRAELADARGWPVAGRPPWSLLALWVVLVAAPVLSFSLLGASFVRPSRLSVGHLPKGGEPIAAFAPLRGQRSVHPSGTALEIVASARGVRVVASDGGGVGGLPLRSDAPIEALRVVRVRDSYGLQLMQGGRSYVTWIDRSGVRLDDDLRARLLDRVPSWALLLMLLSLLSTAVALLPVLAALAELRRLYALAGVQSPSDALAERRARAIFGSFVVALLLVPLAVLSLYWGVRSAFG